MMESLRQEMLHAASVLAQGGMLPATDGNFSARLSESRILLTRSGIEKRSLRAEDLIEVSLNEAAPVDASSEWQLHRALYRQRPEINCILHVHSPALTAFAAARKIPDAALLAEAAMTIGEIALAEFAQPGTTEMGNAALRASKSAMVYLLANHGAVAVGESVRETLYRLERAEFLARVQSNAATLGGGVPLSQDELNKLLSA